MKEKLVKRALDNFIYNYGENTPLAVYEAMKNNQDAFLPGVELCEAYEHEIPETLYPSVSEYISDLQWAYTQVLREAAEELKEKGEVFFFFQGKHYNVRKQLCGEFIVSYYENASDLLQSNPNDGGYVEGTELEAVTFMLDDEVSLWA